MTDRGQEGAHRPPVADGLHGGEAAVTPDPAPEAGVAAAERASDEDARATGEAATSGDASGQDVPADAGGSSDEGEPPD